MLFSPSKLMTESRPCSIYPARSDRVEHQSRQMLLARIQQWFNRKDVMGSSCFACPTSFLIVLVGASDFPLGTTSLPKSGSLGGAIPTSYTRVYVPSQSDWLTDGHRKKLVQLKPILELSVEILGKRSSLPTGIAELGEIKGWSWWRSFCLHVWRPSLREVNTEESRAKEGKKNWVLMTLFEHKNRTRPETNTSRL